MNKTSYLYDASTGINKFLAGVLLFSLLVWSMGLPMILPILRANAITYYSYASDLLSTSKTTALANHTIKFDVPTLTNSTDTLTLSFPVTSAFTFSNLGIEDFDFATSSSIDGTYSESPILVYQTASCAAGLTAFVVSTSSNLTTSPYVVTFTHCSASQNLAASTFS